MDLPDVNVWLALAFPAHAHHAAARAWFDAGPADRPCHFCRVTQQGFLRLANNPAVFPHAAVTQDRAWALYDDFLALPRVGFGPEPAGLDPVWRGFTSGAAFSPQVWTDAYLAAFAVAGGYLVVTFDAGFARFVGAAVTTLP